MQRTSLALRLAMLETEEDVLFLPEDEPLTCGDAPGPRPLAERLAALEQPAGTGELSVLRLTLGAYILALNRAGVDRPWLSKTLRYLKNVFDADSATPLRTLVREASLKMTSPQIKSRKEGKEALYILFVAPFARMDPKTRGKRSA